MSLKKQYIKSKPVCKVTFILAKNIADRATLVGEFNNWDIESIPMKKTKSGELSVTIELEKGREYQFKYFINGNEWINELEADKYVQNEFLSENSVIIV